MVPMPSASPVSAGAAAVLVPIVLSFTATTAAASSLTTVTGATARTVLSAVQIAVGVAGNAVSIDSITTASAGSARALQQRVNVLTSATFNVRIDAAALVNSPAILTLNPILATLNPNTNPSDLATLTTNLNSLAAGAASSPVGIQSQVAAAVAANPLAVTELGNAGAITARIPGVTALPPASNPSPGPGTPAWLIPVAVIFPSILFFGLVYAFFLCFKRLAADADGKEAEAAAVGVVDAPAAAAATLPGTAIATAVTLRAPAAEGEECAGRGARGAARKAASHAPPPDPPPDMDPMYRGKFANDMYSSEFAKGSKA